MDLGHLRRKKHADLGMGRSGDGSIPLGPSGAGEGGTTTATYIPCQLILFVDISDILWLLLYWYRSNESQGYEGKADSPDLCFGLPKLTESQADGA